MGIFIHSKKPDTPITVVGKEFQMTQPEKMQSSSIDGFLSPADSQLPSKVESNGYDGLPAFLKIRRSLFGLAYRMTGSAAEAEDIVQEVWLRWQTTNRSRVLDPSAFLRTTTIRICMNLYQSARLRREIYFGEWLFEPIDIAADPSLSAERNEALKSAVIMLLEKLRPAERAAYILREAFDYSYCTIAELLRLTEPNVRQLLTRARKRIAGVSWTQPKRIERQDLIEIFTCAAQNGNLAELECFFVSEAASSSRMSVALGS
ncbi:sigma-70 family RNA polymerase sigma factor [Edaphobacter sp. 12200R-103]|jgi:RNA polymerase sigma-70 factor (ECF subfamily)|uniref:sigma-70 family RNA polymerase sigma factor n=1 Tax=Edaphobacter sp. 12200R-103 TaxID=2703788 RepID=UPI00138B2EDD|nr:sigma-70 family RNA polymerase sigma factor [Edaphobacter sp. 12200R-103]QHS53083.1 sigma-70 family RNA polymerase sigma factor [Edaphobacter sp. 12200R-103]